VSEIVLVLISGALVKDNGPPTDRLQRQVESYSRTAGGADDQPRDAVLNMSAAVERARVVMLGEATSQPIYDGRSIPNRLIARVRVTFTPQ
jgi:hypothetical protein